jgi:hypothetical protein
MSQRTDGGRVVATIPPMLGTSWLLQWATGNDATSLTPVTVTTTVRAVTIERAVADVRLELRPDEPDGEAVLLWNHPGVLDPTAGLQPVDLAPMARKRLSDRLAAANQATPPRTLTLPVRLVATTGGPVGVSGTDLRVTYTVAAAASGTALALRGEPRPLDLTAPAALRPSAADIKVTARHLGRELNGPVQPAAPDGGPGVVVTGDRWVARALPVIASGSGTDVGLAAVTVDVSADDDAELAVEIRADIQGVPGPVLAGAVVRIDPGRRATRELLLEPPTEVGAGSVVWVSARATTGGVRWYGDAGDLAVALPAVAGPLARVSADRGTTWAPVDDRLAGATAPRARLFHAVAMPYTPPTLVISAGSATVASLPTTPAGAPDEFNVPDGTVAPALLDLLGRTHGIGKVTTAVGVASQAALDVKVIGIGLSYPPTASATGS